MKRSFIAAIIVICIGFGSFPCLTLSEESSLPVAEQFSATNTVDQADAYEIKEPFVSAEQWASQLNSNNRSFKKTDLEHEAIQSVLEKKGIAGLNKYQYHQVLKEESVDSFVLDELLIVFNVKEPKFSNDEYNALFTSFEHQSGFYVGALKQEYSSEKLLDLIGVLINDSNVALIQPNFIYEFTSSTSVTADYTYTLTRAMEQVKATEAWDYYTGDGVIVGMIDSGVNQRSGQNLYSQNQNDNCNDPLCVGHGTAVSTVIGGNGAYAGVAPDCIIYCSTSHEHEDNTDNDGDDRKEIFTDDFDDEINSLTGAGCRIINMSVSLTDYGIDLLVNIMQNEHSNVLFVQTSGNDGINLDTDSSYTYHTLPNYIRVSAVDMNDDLREFNYGQNTVHIAAPGWQLSLPTKDGNRDLMNGTSFSAPFISGTAALLLEADPTLTAGELKNIILYTADNVAGLFGKIQSKRRLNVMAAVEYVRPSNCVIKSIGWDQNMISISENGSGRILEGVKRVVQVPSGYAYQTTGNQLYFLRGPLSANATPVLIPNTQNTVSFAASWGNLVVYNGSTLRRYIFNEATQNYVYNNVTHSNVKCYALSGNRLILYYTIATKFRVYENFRTSMTYEHYETSGVVDSIWVTGSRIHLYKDDGLYEMYDSVADTRPPYAPATTDDTTNRKYLGSVCSETNFSFITSMSATRWCYASGNKIYLYNFEAGVDSEGPSVRESVAVEITAPNGNNISSCKIVNDYIYFIAGHEFYVAELLRETGPIYDWQKLASDAMFFSCCGRNIGYVNLSRDYYYFTKSATIPWPSPGQEWTILGEGVYSLSVYY